MGCDIHAHTEVKIDGKWHHADQPRFERNYTVFTKMAGVRSQPGIQPFSKPRGIPDDVTEFTKFACEHLGEDGHSHSWLAAAEVAELGDFLESEYRKYSEKYFYAEKVIGYIFGNGWDQFTKYKQDLPTGVEDARIVFWFDN